MYGGRGGITRASHPTANRVRSTGWCSRYECESVRCVYDHRSKLGKYGTPRSNTGRTNASVSVRVYWRWHCCEYNARDSVAWWCSLTVCCLKVAVVTDGIGRDGGVQNGLPLGKV